MTVTEVELLALDRRDRAEVLHRGVQSLDPGAAAEDDQAEVDAASELLEAAERYGASCTASTDSPLCHPWNS